MGRIFEKYVYSKIQKKIPVVINILVTFIIVIIGWVFFFSNSYTESVSYLGAMFGANGVGYDGMGLFLLLNNLVLMIIAWIPSVTDFEGVKLPKALKWIICIFVFVLTITFLVSESYNPFLYFRF